MILFTYMHVFDSLRICFVVSLQCCNNELGGEKNSKAFNYICMHVYMYLCIYLHQTRHRSFLKRCSNWRSKWHTVFYWSAFQEVFSCLVDVHLNHLPFELSPLRYQHLKTRSDTSWQMFQQILKTLKKNHNGPLFNSTDCGNTPMLKYTK